MICISIAETDYALCIKAVQKYPLLEIRMDLCDFILEQVKDLFSKFGQKLIATFKPGKVSDEIRKNFLKTAIEEGAGYIDIEIDSSEAYSSDIIATAKNFNCKIITSYHNYIETPKILTLNSIIDKCFSMNADIAKIVCKVNSFRDCSRLISLYDKISNKKLIAFGLGELGKITRIAAPLLGAPFTYASLSKGKETADGQIDIGTMEKIFELIK